MKKSIYLTVLMLIFSMKGFSADVIIRSHADAQAFINASANREPVDNLTIDGADITQSDINGIEGRVSQVNGRLTIDNLKLSTDDRVTHLKSFFDNVKPLNGGIELGNIPYLDWEGIGEGNIPETVNGDLIFRTKMAFAGCQGYSTSYGFGTIKHVKGDFIVYSYSDNSRPDDCFLNLERVDGDFKLYLLGTAWVWNINAPNFTYIGGNFELRTNEDGLSSISTDADGWYVPVLLWDLRILEHIEHIGGDVTIANFSRIQLGNGIAGSTGTGYCFLRYLIDSEVIDYACNDVTVIYRDITFKHKQVNGKLVYWDANGQETFEDTGDPVYTGEIVKNEQIVLDLATLGACLWGDGENRDDPPLPLPDKDPDCYQTGIPTPPQVSKMASVYSVGEYWVVESRAALSQIDIYDIQGKKITTYHNLPAGQKNSLSTGKLPKGAYLVKLTGARGAIQVEKIVRN